MKLRCTDPGEPSGPGFYLKLVFLFMKCVVYRSVKKDGYYLYLEFGKKLSDVPGELLQKFGSLKQIMLIDLDRKKDLQQIPAGKLSEILAEKHYFVYIQSPEAIEKIISEKLLQDS